MASSMLSGSQGVVLATAMAVSGTVILLAFGLQKSSTQFAIKIPIPHSSSQPILRSCISSDGRKREKKKKKRVQFAEDVAEPSGNSEEYRRQHTSTSRLMKDENEGKIPPNRMALYNGILRDRAVVHRFAYSSY
ncbi:uncharacterized protein LOC132279913 [Cornus florida]|uniref:uncharacterized protein LOC132279913 n=1 Tax=Cornus florida TaxID=4283 RepID=UPI00289A7E6C|nr:uncharacterized protein LOC132279913 [Cornus florida]